MYQNLFVIAFFAFIYGLVSKRIETTSINGPLLFVLFGLFSGPFGIGILDVEFNSELINFLAEITLALVLFTDASMINIKMAGRNINIPKRLLLIGLPLTIGFGFIVAYFVFKEFTRIEAAILAVIVAPTDAALGKAVVTNTKVPEKIRQSLNIESGLNDGLCVPFLLLFFALSKESISGQEILLNIYFTKTIGIGAISGLGLAYIGFYLLKKAMKSGWIGASWYRILVITLAISIFSLAQFLGGSGFIACFSGGVLFGYLTRNHKQKLEIAAEGIGDTMSLITWVLFGATIIPIFIKEFQLLMVVYAILSLTLIRMIPVYIALIGLRLNYKTKLFMGWFGPRGLASIVFIFMVMEQDLPHGKWIALFGVCTILLSVIMHGLSTNPVVNRFAQS